LFNENFPTENPAAFENGYVQDLFRKMQAGQNPASKWQTLLNNGCPGETTDGVIGNGPLRKELEERGLPVTVTPGSWIESTVSTAACPYTYTQGHPLHREYGQQRSQLESALDVIRKENTGTTAAKHPVQLVTMNIGANDIIRALGKCEAEVKAEYEATGDSKYNHPPYYEPEHEGHSEKDARGGCAKGHVGEIFHHIFGNVIAIGDAIERGGELALCTGKKSPCTASEKAVNYDSPFKFLGFYDPYGSVFEETSNACQKTPSPAACNREIVEGSLVLDAILNIDMNELIEEILPHGCFANPEPAFNPGIINKPELEWGEGAFGSLVSTGHGGKPNGKGGIEPDPSPLGTLQKYTNMANFTTATNPEAVNDQYKGKNGPGDIHPTPLGYEVLANTMQEQCP